MVWCGFCFPAAFRPKIVHFRILKAYFPLDEKFARREIFIPMGMRNKTIMQ